MIIIRKFFSDTNEETGNQKKSGKGAGKTIIAGGALLGAGFKAKRNYDDLDYRIKNKLARARVVDTKKRLNIIDWANFFADRKGITPEYREEARETLRNIDGKMKPFEDATKRFKKRADKLLPKAATKGAIKGAAVGGLVGAGLYYGLKKGRDLVAKKDAQVTKKQKED